jgi:hypothetical protein
MFFRKYKKLKRVINSLEENILKNNNPEYLHDKALKYLDLKLKLNKYKFNYFLSVLFATILTFLLITIFTK